MTLMITSSCCVEWDYSVLCIVDNEVLLITLSLLAFWYKKFSCLRNINGGLMSLHVTYLAMWPTVFPHTCSRAVQGNHVSQILLNDM